MKNNNNKKKKKNNNKICRPYNLYYFSNYFNTFTFFNV